MNYKKEKILISKMTASERKSLKFHEKKDLFLLITKRFLRHINYNSCNKRIFILFISSLLKIVLLVTKILRTPVRKI